MGEKTPKAAGCAADVVRPTEGQADAGSAGDRSYYPGGNGLAGRQADAYSRANLECDGFLGSGGRIVFANRAIASVCHDRVVRLK